MGVLMKQTIVLLFTVVCSSVLAFYSPFGESQKEYEYRMNKTVLDAMIKVLKKPIILQPTNGHVQEAQHFVTTTYGLNAQPIADHLRSLITKKDDSFEQRKHIDILMMALLFEHNNKGKEAAATSKISAQYLEIFPLLIDTLCNTPEQDLVLKASWQILSTMPSLYDSFCAMGVISQPYKALFDDHEFEKAPQSTRLLHNYLNLMARVAGSDEPRKEILLARLVQKLGKNTRFLAYSNQQYSHFTVFKMALDTLGISYIGSQTCIQAFANHTDSDKIHHVLKLIGTEIQLFEHEVIDENFAASQKQP